MNKIEMLQADVDAAGDAAKSTMNRIFALRDAGAPQEEIDAAIAADDAAIDRHHYALMALETALAEQD